MLLLVCENNLYSDVLLDAIQANDTKTFEKYLKDPAIIIPEDAVFQAAKAGRKQIVELLLKKNAPIDDLSVYWAAFEGYEDIVKILLEKGALVEPDSIYEPSRKGHKTLVTLLFPYADRSVLLDIVKDHPQTMNILPPDMQEYITWIQNKSKFDTLSKKDALKFAAIAFTMPAFSNEFQKLLPYFTTAKDFEIFTQTLIHNALMTRNIEGFKLLLPHMAHNRDWVNILRDELKHIEANIDPMQDKSFIDKIRNLIKQETGRPGFNKGDAKFTFK